jgi:Asp-tRNAAsn/Glu-tRNAGln amidotransferase A subunit and related amidases
MASVKMPTAAELAKVGTELGMNLSDSDIAFFLETMPGNVAAYNLLESLPDNLPAVKYPRTPGYRPEGEENKYNLWYRKSEIKGAADGKLKGKRVALKDNVCLAGVPMMNGASTLEGYVPDVDATVVTRVLDAGATVVGKVRCEYFCFSGGSHTSARGRSTIRASTATRPAARRRAAPPSSSPARPTWRSAATRAARSACRRPIAASSA